MNIIPAQQVAALLGLADQVVNEPSDAGFRRRLLDAITRSQADLRQLGYVESAIRKILVRRFKIVDGVNTIQGLETRELHNLVGTLANRLRLVRFHRFLAQFLVMRAAYAPALHGPCSTLSDAPQKQLSAALF